VYVQRKLALLTLLAVLIAAATASVVFAGGRTVAVRDNRFGPKSITVGKGTKVTWVWRGHHLHNVTASNGSFRSATKRRGTYTHRFNRKGTYRILCTIHSGMKMTVHVK
jgi:plastocyanin